MAESTGPASGTSTTAASKKKTAKGSLLVQELRAAGHDDLADKQQTLDDLYASLAVETTAASPSTGGPVHRRPLKDDEHEIQLANQFTLDELEQVQLVEYGTFEATQTIDVGNAHAYHRGFPVPITNVEANGYLEAGKVRRVKKEEV